MTTTPYGPCDPWPAVFPCDVSTFSPAATGRAVTAATQVLDSLSGRQFGTCTITLRPCRRGCDIAVGWQPWPTAYTYPQPVLVGGQWFNWVCGCPGSCSCTDMSLRQAELPGLVNSIVSVKVDGVVLVTGSYRVDDNRVLVRTDGANWPACNDLAKDDTQVGTWSVTAAFGKPVPELGQLAAGELACELLRAGSDSGEDCRLPRNVIQLVRQGVTVQFPNWYELLRSGEVGLYQCDLFLRAVNPNGLPRRAKTYRVDDAGPWRVNT